MTLPLESAQDNNAWEDATILVQSIKTGQRKTLVDGGYFGRYIHRHQALMFNDGNTLVVAPHSVNGYSFAAAQPRRWSNTTTSLQSFTAGFFDVTRDGKRVVAAMAGLSAAGQLTHITFLLNFADELRRNASSQ